MSSPSPQQLADLGHDLRLAIEILLAAANHLIAAVEVLNFETDAPHDPQHARARPAADRRHAASNPSGEIPSRPIS